MQSSSTDPILLWNLVTLETCENDYDSAIVNSPEHGAL
ncbi:unnamed protein product, partial [Rotaria socialis]